MRISPQVATSHRIYYHLSMQVHLSLGSNIGDREQNLHRAVDLLSDSPAVKVVAQSRRYETEPVGDIPQGPFLNMAISVDTNLSPRMLLDLAKSIEQAMGRREEVRWGPRIIDIDIILWGSAVINEPELTIPHPEFRKRAFVLVPLADIAPDEIDPVSNLSIKALLASLDSCDGML